MVMLAMWCTKKSFVTLCPTSGLILFTSTMEKTISSTMTADPSSIKNGCSTDMLGDAKAKKQSQPKKVKKPKSIDMNAVSGSSVHQHTRHLDTSSTMARKHPYPSGM